VADDVVLRGDETIKDDKGKVVRGLRLCVVKEHDKEHAHRLLNRDVNAARNIWMILDAVLFGRPRPKHLVIQRTAKKATLDASHSDLSEFPPSSSIMDPIGIR
jgi:hypothetical protein